MWDAHAHFACGNRGGWSLCDGGGGMDALVDYLLNVNKCQHSKRKERKKIYQKGLELLLSCSSGDG